jgi:hypothetical protein
MMKSLTLFTLIAFFLLTTSCGQSYDEYGYGQESYEQYPSEMDNLNSNGHYQAQPVNLQQGDGNLVMHPVVNPQTGQLSGHIPLPADWKVTAQGLTGPNGIVAQDFQIQQLQGNVQSIDQVLQYHVYPILKQNNGQILRTIDLPEVARHDQQMYAQYWKFAPSQDFHQARGIEVKGPDGNMALIVVHFLNSRSQFGNYACYNLSSLTAQPSDFEAAKKTYLYGITHYRSDPQAIAAHNQREQQRANASNQAHNQRMRANKQNFDNWQRIQQTNSEIGDIYMDTWRNTSNMQDQGHQNTINGIYEQDAMVNPYDNSTFNAPSQYNQYYMNQNGEYIGTDDAFYNPQNDPNVNHMEWREVRRRR